MEGGGHPRSLPRGRVGSLRNGRIVGPLQRAAGGDELRQEFGRRAGDGRPAVVVSEHHEFATKGIDDGHPGLLTHEHPGGVVPRAMRAGRTVDVAVEHPLCDRAQVERCCAERAELLPAEVAVGVAGHADDRRGHLRGAGGLQRCAIDGRAPAAPRLEPTSGRLVHHERGARSGGVDGAEAGGEPGDATAGIGRAVDRVDDDDDVSVAVGDAALLAQPAEPRGVEHREARVVGGEVGAVLPGAGAGEPPVAEPVERFADGGGGLAQRAEDGVVVHGRTTVAGPIRVSALTPSRGRLVPMASIDVPGFIADLKDHAVDHGFHVHDERHFVETYSLRQAWEVDLHPDEACGGPLDLHLALDVDPRVLLAFEDVLLSIGEDDDPPDEFHFPLIFTWALPPLPSGPDLLVLATELAGLGGPDLPLEVSAIDSFGAVTDAPERSLAIVARVEVSLARVFLGQEQLCDTLDRCLDVSSFLLDRAPVWLDEF